MGKKRVEESGAGFEGMENLSFDTSAAPVIPQVQRVPRQVEYPMAEEKPSKNSYEDDEEPVSCLRNERVIVRFVPRETAMVKDPKHVLGGGMAEKATRSFVVPILSSTGHYKNVLTNSEMKFLEKIMGMEKGALSVYKRTDNFWDDSNPNGIGRVTLHKQDNYLDLNSPTDYIKYKILLANKDYIAASLQELEDYPKATHQFVIISENAEATSRLNKADITMKCYMEYGKVENDADTLRVIIELLEGRPVGSGNVKLDFLKGKIIEWISRNSRQFLNIITDELLPAKVLIKKCVEAGLIGKRNDAYFLMDGNVPLCEINEESTLNNAAKYLSSVKRQELKYTLEAKLKQ